MGEIRRRLFLCSTAGLLATLTTPATARARDSAIDLHRWRSTADFSRGRGQGVGMLDTDEITISRSIGTAAHPEQGRREVYDYARWISTTRKVHFGATRMVVSWNACTPPGTWIEIETRGRTHTGEWTRWYGLGRWASGDTDIHRTSLTGQTDQHAAVTVDTLSTHPGTTLLGYQVRLTLYRAIGTTVSPTVSQVAVMASAIPDRFEVPQSPPGGAWGTDLCVPRYSQNVHKGHYPRYGGGGEAWCSPTATHMVLEYWGKHPSAADLSWIDSAHKDPAVDHAARHTYDYSYRGTGNWAFNTAYAATYGLAAHVTRFHSLAEVERYVLAGVPIITSQSFHAGELDGADYDTEGHIMVVVGFTATGDVLAHDPASSSDESVRTRYRRDQFENIWLRTQRYDAAGKLASGSGGIAYVLTPPYFPLPV